MRSPPSPLDIRPCFVGDSFVNGTGDPDCLGWTGRLCAAAQRNGANLTYYNLGGRRETTAEIARRWEAEVATRLRDGDRHSLVFCFGVNDTAEDGGRLRLPPEQSCAQAQCLLGAARSRWPGRWIGPPVTGLEHNQRIADLCDRFARLSRTLDIPYRPAFAALQADPCRQTEVANTEVANNDGAHPRAAGYVAWAALVQA